MFEALLADDALFANGWGGFGIAIQAYQKRAVPLVRLGRRGGAGAWPQADGPAGQGRLLGHRDQGRAGRGPARLSGIHAQGRDRRVLSRLRQGAARGERRHLPGVRDPQCEHASANQGAGPAQRRSSSSGCTAWARGCTRSWPSSSRRSATRRRRCGSTRRSGATRSCSPISSAGCSKTAPIPPSSTASPTSRCRSTNWCGTRSPSSMRSSPSATRRSRCRAIFRRGSAATAPASICPTRWCASRCSNGWRHSKAAAGPPGRRSGRARAGRSLRPTTAGSRSARCSRRAPPKSTGWSAPATPRRSDWDALGGEARARLLDRAADLYEEHREEFFSLCIREAGKTLVDAVLEVREAVDFLRFYASEARRQFTRPMPLPGPTGEQNELRLHGRGVFAQHLAVEFPAGDLHRPDVGAAGRGQCRHRQAGRANAADRRARGRADAPGGHSQGRRPARARPGQGRRRNADRASAACRRRFHRLDRDRAHDQPHAGRARRADHPVHRRDRRTECDDRRSARLCPSRSLATSFPRPSRARASAARRCGCCSSRRTSPMA